jgi:hypothetical protein
MSNKSLIEMPFGEYLIQVRALTREQLFHALHFKDLNPTMRIGDCIVTLRYLSDREIEILHRAYIDLDVIEIELEEHTPERWF